MRRLPALLALMVFGASLTLCSNLFAQAGTGEIVLTITRSDGTPAVGMKVTITFVPAEPKPGGGTSYDGDLHHGAIDLAPPARPHFTQVTDDKGHVDFKNVPAGRWTALCGNPLTTGIGGTSVELDAGKTVNAEIKLTPPKKKA